MANREQLRIIRTARAGDAAAQLALGRHYLFGGGLPKNIATAMYWLDRAALQQVTEAWMLIGSHIPFAGTQHVVDTSRLATWYEKAFDAGVMQAGLALAQLVHAQGDDLQDLALRCKAQRALQSAAQAGIADAQWLLAQQGRRTGSNRLPSFPAQPALTAQTATAPCEWTKRAADSGVLEARFALADHAWARADYAAFLRWSLPLARQLMGRSPALSN